MFCDFLTKKNRLKTQKWFENTGIVALLVSVAGFLVYFNSLNGEFQFDDEWAIVSNSFLRAIRNFFDFNYWLNVQKRPVAFFSFALNYLFNGYNVEGYHLINLSIHILTGITVYGFIKELIRTRKIKYGSENNKYLLPVLAAFVFILHPIQTQAVSYIVQRMASLATLFYILACFSYLRARRITNNDGVSIRAVLYYVLTGLSVYAAIFSKQNAITLPLMIMALELYFVRDGNGKVNYGFLSAIIFTVLLAISFVLPHSQVPLQETTQISRTVYFMTQILVIMKYFQLLIIPVGLNVDHHFKLVQSFGMNESLSFFFCFVLCVFIFIFFKQMRLHSFVIFWFFLTISVESSFIPIKDVIAEHRLYLPMFSFSLVLAYVLKKMIDRYSVYAKIFTIVLLILYAGLTVARNQVWQSKIALWSDTVKKSPFKPRPHNNLGHALVLQDSVSQAKTHFKRAIELNDTYHEAINNLGSVYIREKQYDSAHYYFDMALKLKPNYVPGIINLGICYRELDDIEMSTRQFKRALRISPNNPEANFNIAYNFEQTGKTIRAITNYKKAIEFKPTFADAYYNLGNIYVEKEMLSVAALYYEKALVNNSNHLGALVNRANIHFLQKNYEEAIFLYNKALSVDSAHEEAKKNITLCNQSLKKS